MTLLSVTAYHSFAGEVEASNTPTIRRLTPSCRHQLPRIALWAQARNSQKATLARKANSLRLRSCRCQDRLILRNSGRPELRSSRGLSYLRRLMVRNTAMSELRAINRIDFQVTRFDRSSVQGRS